MKINCIIIDDEPLARKGMKEYIQDVEFLHLLGEFDSPLSAMPFFTEQNVQLIFLDIQMPKLTGIEFLKTISQPPPVIFTTAYPQYALNGFELNALDYLVKPIAFERFLKAANRAKEYYELRQKNTQDNKGYTEEHFFIKVDGQLIKILIQEVLFVEALQNYVAIYTKEKKYITYLSFSSIADYLPSTQFIKTHKSFLAALNKIDRIDGNVLQIGAHQVPVSRNFKEAVMRTVLGAHFLKR